MLHAHTSLEGFAMSEKAGTAILRALGMGITFVSEDLDTSKKSGVASWRSYDKLLWM
jgi:hypothetical protein